MQPQEIVRFLGLFRCLSLSGGSKPGSKPDIEDAASRFWQWSDIDGIRV